MTRPDTPQTSEVQTARNQPARVRTARRPLLSRFSPPQLIALSFALSILLGGALLKLPALQQPGQNLNLLDAMFMATSAVCVTGLSVVDLGSTFNLGGQLLTLLLVQVGGLGIITFGTLFATFARRRLAFSERFRLAQQVNAPDFGSVPGLLRGIFLYTFLTEAAGAVLLAVRFVPQFGWGKGLYYSVFHSVVAFNNAGFALFPGNLRAYVADPLVSLVIPALIVLGGLGFLVQLNVLAHLRDRRHVRLLVQSKVVLTSMAALLLGGTLLVALLEWTNPHTLGPLPLGGKLLASFFQAVTPRTSGLSTLNTELLRPATLLLILGLMFVGANPGSTGGGIKTSTAFVLLGSAWNTVRGRSDLVAFRRRVEPGAVLRALAVTLLSGLLVGAAFLLMLLFNTSPRLDALHLYFETVSAFGTVGLSMNSTPDTSAAQRVLLIVLMYLGRTGPLTFAHAFGHRTRAQDVSYPPERDILIG
jgi:trk system potassium uptake protein